MRIANGGIEKVFVKYNQSYAFVSQSVDNKKYVGLSTGILLDEFLIPAEYDFIADNYTDAYFEKDGKNESMLTEEKKALGFDLKMSNDAGVAFYCKKDGNFVVYFCNQNNAWKVISEDDNVKSIKYFYFYHNGRKCYYNNVFCLCKDNRQFDLVKLTKDGALKYLVKNMKIENVDFSDRSGRIFIHKANNNDKDILLSNNLITILEAEKIFSIDKDKGELIYVILENGEPKTIDFGYKDQVCSKKGFKGLNGGKVVKIAAARNCIDNWDNLFDLGLDWDVNTGLADFILVLEKEGKKAIATADFDEKSETFKVKNRSKYIYDDLEYIKGECPVILDSETDDPVLLPLQVTFRAKIGEEERGVCYDTADQSITILEKAFVKE